jgi:acetoin utilization deacetylase AcuC-like enzyme
MAVAFVIDDVFQGHVAPPGHPERPARLDAVRAGLVKMGVGSRGQALATRRISDDEIGLVHTAGYLRDLERDVPGRSGWLDEDTYFAPGSWEAALRAAGAAVDLTRAAVEGRALRGFGVVRPPGHHAEPDRAMGFCMLNNVAIAAAWARRAGLGKVAIVDWDVHHGNGTQAAFWRDPSVMYLSTHQYPLYPGTGAAAEIGDGAGRGTTVNVPLPAGAGDDDFAAAFDGFIAPTLLHFAPDLILVSAGFDAFRADPLAQMQVSPRGYRRMAEVLRAVADQVCGGRLVCVLEGGYDLDGLSECAGEVFDVLATDETPRPVAAGPALPATTTRLAEVRAALAGHWGIQ